MHRQMLLSQFKYGKDEHRIRIRDSTQDDCEQTCDLFLAGRAVLTLLTFPSITTALVLVSQQVWHDLTNSWDGGVISPFQWSISDK